ncbi:MAG: nickel-dependent hydrogenase large subunit [Gammaproteobacteria bacterium]|nr:nickel-dependent hydrogenase large subunit [Gammaproteobacteria bacterium]
MGIEGQITIALRTGHGRVVGVDIRSSRPLHAPRIFVGRSPAAVLETLPMIYSLCATAQAAAARQALGAALGRAPDAAAAAGRLLVDVETVREHTLGILLGWAEYLGEGPDPAAATMVRLLPAVREAIFAEGRAFALDATVAVDHQALDAALGEMMAVLEERVFGLPVAAWHGLATPGELAAWAGQGTTVAARVVAAAMDDPAPGTTAEGVPLLPDLDDATLGARLRPAGADAFIARPRWQGAPAETSSLSRRRAHTLVACLLESHGDALATRLVARLAELSALAIGLETALPGLADAPSAAAGEGRVRGEGIGQVEAARGRLVHRVELAAGAVTRYQVLAPTEWNFHPEGAAARALTGLAFTDQDDLRRRAALTIRALDPCVGFELVVDGG